jgi:hypothetical protein
MRIEVEELLALVANEVVTRARSSAGYSYALRELEGGFQRRMVDGRDAVDAEPDAEDYEGGLETVIRGFLGCGGEEGGGVDVAVVGAGVDSEGGGGVFVC